MAEKIKKPVIEPLICAISGEDITSLMPLRISHGQNEDLIIELSDKKKKDAVFIVPTLKHIKKVMQEGGIVLGQDFSHYDKSLFQTWSQDIAQLYVQKICSALGFALKSRCAVMGRRAIERLLCHEPHDVAVLLIAKGASTDIAKKLIMLHDKMRVMDNFPEEWLIAITGKEKTSYLALRKHPLSMRVCDDYLQYCAFLEI